MPTVLTFAAVDWSKVGIIGGVAGFLLVCLLLILIILIQRPQGGGLSGAFGSGAGSGQTAFGAKTGDALTIATIGLFVVYILAAIGLNFLVRPPADGPNVTAVSAPGETAPAPVDGAAPADAGATTPAPAAGEQPATPAEPATEVPPPAPSPSTEPGSTEPTPSEPAPSVPAPGATTPATPDPAAPAGGITPPGA